jgi:hypothetical protein
MLMAVGIARDIPVYAERARALGLGETVHFLGAKKDVGLA